MDNRPTSVLVNVQGIRWPAHRDTATAYIISCSRHAASRYARSVLQIIALPASPARSPSLSPRLLPLCLISLALMALVLSLFPVCLSVCLHAHLSASLPLFLLQVITPPLLPSPINTFYTSFVAWSNFLGVHLGMGLPKVPHLTASYSITPTSCGVTLEYLCFPKGL